MFVRYPFGSLELDTGIENVPDVWGFQCKHITSCVVIFGSLHLGKQTEVPWTPVLKEKSHQKSHDVQLGRVLLTPFVVSQMSPWGLVWQRGVWWQSCKGSGFDVWGEAPISNGHFRRRELPNVKPQQRSHFTCHIYMLMAHSGRSIWEAKCVCYINYL